MHPPEDELYDRAGLMGYVASAFGFGLVLIGGIGLYRFCTTGLRVTGNIGRHMSAPEIFLMLAALLVAGIALLWWGNKQIEPLRRRDRAGRKGPWNRL